MRKYLLLIIACLGISQATYAYKISLNKPLIKGESWEWLNLGLVLLVAGLIIFIVIVRLLYTKRLKGGKPNEATKKAGKKDNIYEPRYWYQCKNCKLTIRKDSPPNTADCFKGIDHFWTQLGEVGTNKYLCKNCNTLIETKTVPVNENCPDAEEHNWELLP